MGWFFWFLDFVFFFGFYPQILVFFEVGVLVCCINSALPERIGFLVTEFFLHLVVMF